MSQHFEDLSVDPEWTRFGALATFARAYVRARESTSGLRSTEERFLCTLGVVQSVRVAGPEDTQVDTEVRERMLLRLDWIKGAFRNARPGDSPSLDGAFGRTSLPSHR